MDEKLLFEEIPLENRYNLLLRHIEKLGKEKEELIDINQKYKKKILKLEYQINNGFLNKESDICDLLHDIKSLSNKNLHEKYKKKFEIWKIKNK